MPDDTKKRKAIPKGGHKLRDAAGRPVIGMNLWGARYVHVDGHHRLVCKAKIVTYVYPEQRKTWVDSRKRVRSQRTREESVRFLGDTKLIAAHDLEAPHCEGMPRMPLLKSLRTNSHFWWVNASGAIERIATEYEARLPDLPPNEGWHLVHTEGVSSLIAYAKKLPTTGGERAETDTERDERERREAAKKKRHAQKLATAQSMVQRYERRIKLDTTLLKKWRRRVNRMEKRS